MKNPLLDQVVYLLYDLHASKVTNPDLIKSSHTDIDTLLKPAGYYLSTRRYGVIQEILDAALASFVNLNKQQKDLLEITRRCGFSLINEDWSEIFTSFGINQNTLSSVICPRYGLKYRSGDNSIAVGLSPINGIGQKLTGEYSANKLIALDGNKYYFNSDMRGVYVSGGTKEDVDRMDRKTVEVIQKLFNDYSQEAIIVSQGAKHTENISIMLSDLGYETERVYFNPQLVTFSAGNPNLAHIISQINANKRVDNQYYLNELPLLAECPIDLQEAFGEDLLKYCKTTTTATAAKQKTPADVLAIATEDLAPISAASMPSTDQQKEAASDSPADEKSIILTSPASAPFTIVRPLLSADSGMALAGLAIATEDLAPRGTASTPSAKQNLYKIELVSTLNKVDYSTLINLTLNEKAPILKESGNNLAIIEQVLTFFGLEYNQSIKLKLSEKNTLLSDTI